MGEDALLRLAGDLLCQSLIHFWRDRNVLRDLVLARGVPLAVAVARIVGTEFAPLALELHPLDRQRAEAERVAEVRGGLFEVDDALCIRLLVDAIDGGHSEALVPVGDALVGGEHELFDQAVGPGAIRAENALHLAFVVEVDDGLG